MDRTQWTNRLGMSIVTQPSSGCVWIRTAAPKSFSEGCIEQWFMV
jgi:hypothetical protein